MGGTFSSRSKETFATVSGTTSATRSGLGPPSSARTRPTACATTGTSGMLSAARPGTTAPGGQGLRRVRHDHVLIAAHRDPRGSDVGVIDLDGDIRRRRGEQVAEAHSTNVTLLISRSVVLPSSTRSTADSRSSRMPCSFAARLTSEIGRFSRMISRM